LTSSIVHGIWPSTFHLTATFRSLPRTDRTLFVVLRLRLALSWATFQSLIASSGIVPNRGIKWFRSMCSLL
jgi:hypothetical protein